MTVGCKYGVKPHYRASARSMRLLFYRLGVATSLMLGNFLFAAVTVHAADTTKPSTLGDAEVRAAHDAYTRLDLRALETARARLQQIAPDHVLLPYAQYWSLSARLGQPQTKPAELYTEVGNLLAAHPAAGFSEGLQRDRLRALADANASEAFLAAYATYTGDDPDILCRQWRFRLANGDREALKEARAQWNAARGAPLTCYDVFQQVIAANLLSTDEQWARVRSLFEQNLGTDARRSAAFISGVSASFDRETLSIQANAARFLANEKLRAKDPGSVTAFLFAVSKLARNDVARAARWMEQHGSSLPAAERARAWAEVGLYAAMQHDEDALTWFGRAGATPLSDTQAAWKTRAALRTRDWLSVQSAINMMSSSERAEPAWRYWHARAEVELGRAEAARAAREKLASEHHFYGILSAEELGSLPAPQWPGFRPAASELDAVRARPGVRRGLALMQLGLRQDALREWASATRNMSDQELLAAAAVAAEKQILDRAIYAADRTQSIHDFSQRYPLPHRDALRAQTQLQRLDEGWVYGLIRQESRFIADIRSHAGAAGLMQLMPATAVWTAKQAGMKNFALRTVTDVPINVRLGCHYLRHVLDQLGHPVLATAAYNAGPNRAKRWQASHALEGAIYAESIPFNETRDYVKKVMVNAWFYQHQLGTAKPSLKALMGTVAGRTASAGAATTVALAQ